jgi:hypothetical protein
MKRTGILLGGIAIVSTIAMPAFATEEIPEFYDTFAQQSFGGNDGSREFDGPWMEEGESNGPTSGFVWVWEHEYCGGGLCLKMGGAEADASGHGLHRTVNLSGATSAKLCFDDGRQLLDDNSEGAAVVQISPDGGDTWKTLDTISLDKDDGGVSFHRQYSISDFATADTVIRFKITSAEDLKAYWIIDNVVIEASFEQTTTTKPREVTTTTTKPREVTTTTTRPPDTTTTTSQPTTTTITRPTTTSTTEAPLILRSGIPPEDRKMMMDKTALAVPAASGINAMPASLSESSESDGYHIEPIDAFATAFATKAGEYGGNLIPSVLLGIVIAAVSLMGIESRRED